MRYLFVFISLFLLVGCGTPSTLKELAEVEIDEYQGERLDSIIDVQDVSIKGPQHVNITTYRLEITGLVDNHRSYTYDEVIDNQKYSKVVQLNCVEGWNAKVLWEGVLLEDLFEDAGVQPEANTVIFYSVDGYTTSLPLDYIKENDIILADKINGYTIPPERGYPFQVVAESKLGYKWAKWITKIELSDDSEYRGYWESRGYSHEAEI